MKDRKNLLVSLLVIIIGCCCYALIGGFSLLHWRLFGELPFGTLLAAVAIASLACLIYLLKIRNNYFTVIVTVCLVMAILWLPISVYLAGNFQLIFSGDNGHYWSVYTKATVIVNLVTLLLILAIKLFHLIRCYFQLNR